MRTDIYTYIQKCLSGLINLDGTYPVIRERKCGSFVYPKIQRDIPDEQQYQLVIHTERSKPCKHNRSLLKRQLEAMYRWDIIQSYTLTERKLTINWAKQYVEIDAHSLTVHTS